MKATTVVTTTRQIEVTEQDLREWMKEKGQIPADWEYFSCKPSMDRDTFTITLENKKNGTPPK